LGKTPPMADTNLNLNLDLGCEAAGSIEMFCADDYTNIRTEAA
jgi:hypothetical protein